MKKPILIIVLAVILFLPLAVFAASTDITQPGMSEANAAVDSGDKSVLAEIAFVLGNVMAGLLLQAIRLFLWIANYNDFINESFVITSWTFVRDICNNFFIVFLLVIAVATILRIESYSYKRMLTKVLVIAIVINFSRTITGLLIDLSQVLTLTFMKGASALIYRLPEFLQISDLRDVANGASSVSVAIISLFVYAIATVVVAIFFLMMLARIITLWFLTILSPLAYLLSILPKTASFANMWWERFSKQLVFGPAIAFFLYLSLFILGSSVTTNTTNSEDGPFQTMVKTQAADTSKETIGEGVISVGEGGKAQRPVKDVNMFGAIMSIVSLIASLIFVQQSGVIGSSFGGKAVSSMQGLASKGSKALGAGVMGATGMTAAKQYAKAGQEALTTRVGRSKLGRKWGIGKESAAALESSRRAKAYEKLGFKSAVGQNTITESGKRNKQDEELGRTIDKDTAKKSYEEYKKSGDVVGQLATLKTRIEKGWIRGVEAINEIESQFGRDKIAADYLTGALKQKDPAAAAMQKNIIGYDKNGISTVKAYRNQEPNGEWKFVPPAGVSEDSEAYKSAIKDQEANPELAVRREAQKYSAVKINELAVDWAKDSKSLINKIKDPQTANEDREKAQQELAFRLAQVQGFRDKAVNSLDQKVKKGLVDDMSEALKVVGNKISTGGITVAADGTKTEVEGTRTEVDKKLKAWGAMSKAEVQPNPRDKIIANVDVKSLADQLKQALASLGKGMIAGAEKAEAEKIADLLGQLRNKAELAATTPEEVLQVGQDFNKIEFEKLSQRPDDYIGEVENKRKIEDVINAYSNVSPRVEPAPTQNAEREDESEVYGEDEEYLGDNAPATGAYYDNALGQQVSSAVADGLKETITQIVAPMSMLTDNLAAIKNLSELKKLVVSMDQIKRTVNATRLKDFPKIAGLLLKAIAVDENMLARLKTKAEQEGADWKGFVPGEIDLARNDAISEEIGKGNIKPSQGEDQDIDRLKNEFKNQ